MCTKKIIYQPMDVHHQGLNFTVAVNPATNLKRVSAITDTLTNLANRLELPLGVVVEKLKLAQAFPSVYEMIDDNVLTKRQIVNRLIKIIAE